MFNQNPLILLTFDKRGDTYGEDVILEANSAGRCFVLRDLISVNFSK